MKGYHFFLEYPSSTEAKKATRKNLGEKHQGNVLALIVPLQYDANYHMDCVCATFFYPNSTVMYGSCSREYLKQCKRISEAQARKIHPELFKRLDSED